MVDDPPLGRAGKPLRIGARVLVEKDGETFEATVSSYGGGSLLVVPERDPPRPSEALGVKVDARCTTLLKEPASDIEDRIREFDEGFGVEPDPSKRTVVRAHVEGLAEARDPVHIGGGRFLIAVRTLSTQEFQELLRTQAEIFDVAVEDQAIDCDWQVGPLPKKFNRCFFDRSKFQRSNLLEFGFSDCSFKDCVFDRAATVKARFKCCEFDKAVVVDCVIGGASFVECDFKKARMRGLIATGRSRALRTKFRACGFGEAELIDCRLAETLFRNCDLTDATFERADLSGARFTLSELTRVSIEHSTLSADTSFARVLTVEGCRIDRTALESLRDYGGLTVSQRRSMSIKNDIATLRRQFGGYAGVIHTFAVAIFVAPYVAFLLRKYWGAQLRPCTTDDCEPLFEAFGYYVLSGGHTSGTFSPTFLVFLALLAYNAARAIVLWKTKALEWQEHVTGVAPHFELVGVWRTFLTIVHVGFYINLVLVLLHTISFLGILVSYP